MRYNLKCNYIFSRKFNKCSISLVMTIYFTHAFMLLYTYLNMISSRNRIYHWYLRHKTLGWIFAIFSSIIMNLFQLSFWRYRVSHSFKLISQLRRPIKHSSDVIKEHIFPSLSHFDLIFIVLARRQARRRVRVARPEFNAILRLIRTFKAVNEDWPHVPSARSLSPHRPASSYALPLRVARICVCICVSVYMYALSKMCWYGTYMQPEHLWCSTPNVFSTLLLLVQGCNLCKIK